MLFSEMLPWIVRLVLPWWGEREEISVRYSEYSGMVTEMKFGTPSQELKVGLDFNSEATSRMYSYDTACPLSQHHACFNSMRSSSFHTQNDRFRFRDFSGFISGINGRDSVEIGNHLIADFEFELIRIHQPRTLDFLDVAGVVRANKLSPLFTGQIVEIRDTGDTRTDVTFRRVVSMENVGIVIPTVPHESAWVTVGTLSLNGNEILSGVNFQYNPGELDLVFPSAGIFGMEFIAAIGPDASMDAQNRLHVPCEYPIQFLIEVEGHSLVIDPIHVKTSGIGSCETRIRFSDSITDRIVIGRVLTRSVHKIFLNYSDGTVGIEAGQGGRRNTAKPVHAYLPIFAEPFLINRMGSEGLIFSVISQPGIGGLVPVGEHGKLIQLDHSEIAFGYVFIRTHPDLSLEGRTDERLLIRNANGCRIRHDLDQIVIHGENDSGENSIWLRLSRDFVTVLYRSGAERSRRVLDLPPAHTISEASTENECRICLAHLEKGDLVQGLHDCPHQYHKTCLDPWLRRSGTCPTCRSRIRAVQVPVTTTTTRQPREPRRIRHFPI